MRLQLNNCVEVPGEFVFRPGGIHRWPEERGSGRIVSRKLAGEVGASGGRRLPTGLVVGLPYLKHAYNESDDSECERKAQDTHFQFFCGCRLSAKRGGPGIWTVG